MSTLWPQNLSNTVLTELPVKKYYTVDFLTEKGKKYEVVID